MTTEAEPREESASILIEMIDMSSAHHLLTAEQATARLGVSRQTLYTYVSRGLVRAHPVPGDSRRSAYDERDIAVLLEKRGRGRARHAVASSTTDWREPILRSSLTRITDGTYQYRGQDAVTLSSSATLEEVAALLWQQPVTAVPEPAGAGPGFAIPIERCLHAVAAAAASNDWATESTHLAATAARLLGVVMGAACGLESAPKNGMLHERLAEAWGLDKSGADLVRRVLVLCADHELNASAYAARVVASTGASLGACVLAGLAALSGPRHGGMTQRVLALAADPVIQTNPARGLGERLADGEALPGFGHRLYPEGDPRCRALLSALPPPHPWPSMIETAARLTGQHPTIDVALAILETVLPLPPGGGLALFAVGRTVGWIAHALEQRIENRLIRPRANYGSS